MDLGDMAMEDYAVGDKLSAERSIPTGLQLHNVDKRRPNKLYHTKRSGHAFGYVFCHG